MITLENIKWSDAFSYGENNSLQLNSSQITQILGVNGAGKSSLPLIIEEVLFNKNSKGIKRGDILNRFSKNKKYFIELEFSKDLEKYLIRVSRGITQSVSLFKFVEEEWSDISNHTATATYKNIENLLGFNHETFVSLIYQSSAQSMQFLTSTDTIRKKFLIELLGLTKYTEAFENFKELSKEVSIQVVEVEAKINTIQRWLDKNLKIDLTLGEYIETPAEPKELLEDLGKLNTEMFLIDDTNKQITKNNQYKKSLDSIVLDLEAVKPEDATKYIKEKTILEFEIKSARADIKKATLLNDTCPTCKQSVDISFVPALIKEKEVIEKEAYEKLELVQRSIKFIEEVQTRFNKAEKSKLDFETYSQLYNPKLSKELKDKDSLNSQISTLRVFISSLEKEISEAIEHNKKVAAKNAQIEVIKEQSTGMSEELKDLTVELDKLSDKAAILEILKKAFSTNGLLAYKIECLVKDLEDLANEYLGELSGGRFQLSFKVVGEKLNVIITDNGHDIDISALSSGEKARVNTATLLAIRKLMQALSSTKINLLILDETLENLDIYGKEKLIDVLLNEPDLNTFLISHSFSHPLLEKITVVKENNISRIEHG